MVPRALPVGLHILIAGGMEMSWSQKDILGDDAADCFNTRKIHKKKGV
jgi:hypothetical protein